MKTIIALFVAAFALQFNVASANQHEGKDVAKKSAKKPAKKGEKHEDHGAGHEAAEGQHQ